MVVVSEDGSRLFFNISITQYNEEKARHKKALNYFSIGLLYIDKSSIFNPLVHCKPPGFSHSQIHCYLLSIQMHQMKP